MHAYGFFNFYSIAHVMILGFNNFKTYFFIKNAFVGQTSMKGKQ